MNRLQQLLTLVSEECHETGQRATKIIRFGLDEVQEDINQNPKQLNNAERLIYEFNDLLAVMELLAAEGYISHVIDDAAIQAKFDKIRKYTKYSQSLGLVNHN